MTPVPSGLLLDTCTILFLAEHQSVNPTADTALEAARMGPGVFVSPVSAWEIGMLTRPRGDRPARLALSMPVTQWLDMFMDRPGLFPAPFTVSIALHASLLPPGLHDDPGDRLLVATARALGLAIVTRDRKILDYANAGHVKAIPC